MAKRNNSAVKGPKLKFTVNHALTTIYTALMFMVFPLFLTNYYQSARRDKFWFFVVVTFAIGLPVLIITLINQDNKKVYKDPFKLNLTDIGVLAFLGVNIISLVGAIVNAEETAGVFSALFLGSYGRNMGVLMILTVAACYFIVSRNFYYTKYIMYIMFFGMTVMSFVAVLNYYYIDVLGIFSKYSGNADVTANFTSTIGNKNYLSAMITVALPFSVGLAVTSEDKNLRIVSYISTALQFMGLLVATSDGGFLGCFAAFAAMLLLFSKNIKRLARFFFCLSIMMASAKLLWLFDIAMQSNSKGYTSFSEIFIYSNWVFPLILLLFGIATCLELFKDSIKFDTQYIFFGVLALIILGVAAIVGCFVYFTLINTDATLGSFTKFFRFNEKWGTHRGFFWIKSFDVIKEFNPWQIIFGSGPDTYYNVFKPFFGELNKYGDSSTNAAHNVYINYLVTIGAAGLLSYLLFIGSAIVNGVKYAKENPLALMCVGVIIAYAVQDIVNIANPVNTPWFIMFIALSESTRLRANSTERLIAEKF